LIDSYVDLLIQLYLHWMIKKWVKFRFEKLSNCSDYRKRTTFVAPGKIASLYSCHKKVKSKSQPFHGIHPHNPWITTHWPRRDGWL